MSLYFEELDYRPTAIGVLSLRRRRSLSTGADIFEIKLGDEFLMSSQFTAAEIELARLGLAARPGAELERREYQERLRRALGTLPEEHRTALTLRYLEGLDYRAIAQTMGVTDGALRGMLGRALGTLRRMPALAQERP